MKHYSFLPALALLLIFSSEAFSAPKSGSGRWDSRPRWAAEEPDYSSEGFFRPKKKKKVQPFSPESHNVAIDVGQVFLMGDLGDRFENNIGGRLSYTYGVSDIFGLNTAVGHSSHSDGDFSMTTLLVGLRTNLAWYDRIVPHLVFGLGFYRPSYQLNEEVTIDPVLFGLHLGPGLNLQLTDRVFFGTSLSFHSIFVSTKTLASGEKVETGGTYTSFLLNAGVTF